MKLLVGFVGACVLMIGALIWSVMGAMPPERKSRLAGQLDDAPVSEISVPEPTIETPPTEPAPAIEAPAQVTSSMTIEAPLSDASLTPATDGSDAEMSPPPVEPSPATSEVRWADDVDQSGVLRRLETARETLRGDPYHELALRDELAALMHLQRWREALNSLRLLRELHPDDPQLRFEQAGVLLSLGRAVEAVPLLRELVGAKPEHARGWFNLAIAHQSLGHIHDARRAWDRAIELEPSPEAYAHRGEVLLDLREWSAAIADLERVLAEQPDARDVAVNMAHAMSHLGRDSEAAAVLEDVVARHPRYLPALLRRADLAWSAWQANKADEDARAAVIHWCRAALDVDEHQRGLRTRLDAAER